jgi:mannosyltransferase OCH1-like enzyme
VISLPIVQYWHNPVLPEDISERTSSFTRFNRTRSHMLFDRQVAGEFISQRFTRRETLAFDACGPPAMQSDYLRYCAILHYGGVWCDADFICARDLTPLLDRSRGGEIFISSRRDDVVMNGFFAFATAGHPFLRLVVDFATELIERRWRGIVSSVTGPRVFTAVFHLCRVGSVDAFLRLTRTAEPRLLPYARVLCDLINGDDQLASAWTGMCAHPPGNFGKWVHKVPRASAFHDPDSHWKRVGSDIYTDVPVR